MNMQTPDRKVTVGLVAGAIMTILAWCSGEFAGVTIPAEVALAGSTVILFALQYLVPNQVIYDAAQGQGGFVRLSILALLLAGALAMIALSGCMHTRDAYRSAETPDEYAYVLAEHYSVLVREAADLAARPSTPDSAVRAMQRADMVARPAVLQLRHLRDAYLDVRTAETEAELQEAINRAVLLIAELVRAVRGARGESVTVVDPVPALTWRLA
jgi:hypothetical protein